MPLPEFIRRRLYGRTLSEQRTNVEDEAWSVPRGKGASASKGRDGVARDQVVAKRLQELGYEKIQVVDTHAGGRISFNPLGRDEQYDRIAPGWQYDDSKRDFLKRAALLGSAGAALALGSGMIGNLIGTARAAPGDGISGVTISPTDIDAKRIAGIRIATEFDTAKHAGTDADPWTITALTGAHSDLPSTGGLIAVPGVYSISSSFNPTKPTEIFGFGRSPTKIIRTGTGDGLSITNRCIVRDLTVDVPIGVNGHGIVAKGDGGFRIENVAVEGIAAGKYGVRVEDSFLFSIRDLAIGGTTAIQGGGMQFVNVGQLLNYGNGKVENVFIILGGGGNVGVYIDGGTGSKLYNLMVFDYLSTQTGQSHPNTMTALKLRNASLNQFNLLNVEGLDVGIDFDSSNGGQGNVFVGPYIADVTTPWRFQGTGRHNRIYGGQPGALTDGSDTVFFMDYQNEIEGRDVFYYKWRRRVEWFDDFLGTSLQPEWMQAAGTWVTQNARFGVVRGTTGVNPGDAARLTFGANLPLKGEYGYLVEVRANRTSAGSDDFYIGVSDGLLGGTSNYVVLHRDSAGNVNIRTRGGAGETVTPTGFSFGASPVVFRVWHKPAPSPSVEVSVFDIDYVKLFSGVVSTTLPSATTGLGPHIELVTGTGARSVDADYCGLAMGRR